MNLARTDHSVQYLTTHRVLLGVSCCTSRHSRRLRNITNIARVHSSTAPYVRDPEPTFGVGGWGGGGGRGGVWGGQVGVKCKGGGEGGGEGGGGGGGGKGGVTTDTHTQSHLCAYQPQSLTTLYQVTTIKMNRVVLSLPVLLQELAEVDRLKASILQLFL